MSDLEWTSETYNGELYEFVRTESGMGFIVRPFGSSDRLVVIDLDLGDVSSESFTTSFINSRDIAKRICDRIARGIHLAKVLSP